MGSFRFPKDLDSKLEIRDKVIAMRSEGKTWREIGENLGCLGQTIRVKAVTEFGFTLRKNKKFTPEEDIEIRRAYLAMEDMDETAARLGRTKGDIYQRLLRKHKEVINTVRSAVGSKAIKRYGKEVLLSLDPDYGVAARKLKELMADAAAKAKEEAAAVRANKVKLEFESADARIAAGEDRNDLIFELRSLGLSLELIGQHFGITPERVRQVFRDGAVKRIVIDEVNKLKVWEDSR